MTEKVNHIIGYRTLTLTWLALLVLTAVTVAVSRIDLGPWNIWMALSIASIKGGFVTAIFMHMRYEPPLLRLTLMTTLVTLAIFIGLTFFDVLYR